MFSRFKFKSSLLLIFCFSFLFSNYNFSENYDQIFHANSVAKTYFPKDINKLQALVAKSVSENRKISVVGAGKSQGGQTICSEPSSYRISLAKLDKLINLNITKKQVTVQAGMTWRKLQEYIAPHKLAVKIMQSYNDFSIGGSLSVNVHGQDFKSGPLIKTVDSFKLLLANGKIINVSRYENKELFGLVIGGYGLFGIITEVTLNVTDDILMERKTKIIDSKYLARYFETQVKNNPSIEFYSARFSLGFSDLLDKAIVVYYKKTNLIDPALFNLQSSINSSSLIQIMLRQYFSLMKESEFVKNTRFVLEKLYFERPKIISRNNFMGFSIEQLPKDDRNSLYILQEYFIPYNQLNDFVDYLRMIVKEYKINLLNVTARHITADKESLLTVTPQESCALVLYVHLKRDNKIYEKTVEWTKKLIDKALEFKGTYYLPYHLIATKEQFQKAYPSFNLFISLKKVYDPREIFTNNLYQKYAS